MSSNKQLKSYNRVFIDTPIPTNVKWEEVISAMERKGYALMKSSGGSSRTFKHKKTNRVHVVHEPHGSDSMPSGQLRRIRRKIA